MSSASTTHDTFAGAPFERDDVSYCSPVISIAIAGAVVGGLVAAGGSGRLPALAGAAAYLFFAVESDARRLRIPNWLNFGALFAALAVAGLGLGSFGPVEALAGVGVAFVLLFPGFAFGWLGAGDVKAAMVLGALFGAGPLLGLLWWAFVASGLIALALVAYRGELLDLVRRWSITLRALLAGAWAPVPAAEGSAAASGIPFALALALGAICFALWGVPWL